MDLSRRSTLPERMDDADFPRADYERCLRDLASVNRITLTHRPTLAWLGRATREFPAGAPVRLLDVACGAGDLLRTIHAWAARRGLRPELVGLDLNPRSAEVAATLTPADMSIDYRTGDVFAARPEPRPDFIVTSQFTHHLDDQDIVRLLRWLDEFAARGWLIADLHRSALAYWGFSALATVARWHPVVRGDGMISVARSFRRADWTRLLQAAGLTAEIHWHPGFRWSVSRLRPNPGEP